MRLLPRPIEITDSPSAMIRIRSYRSVQCSAEVTCQPQVLASSPVAYWKSTTITHSASRISMSLLVPGRNAGTSAAASSRMVLSVNSGAYRSSCRRSTGLSRTTCRNRTRCTARMTR